eukprot:g2267.t1
MVGKAAQVAPEFEGKGDASVGDGADALATAPLSCKEKFNEWMFPKKPPKFGTFTGVFARCLLNIWGVIMFLRLGWMIAHAGLLLSLSIVGVAMLITTVTSLSLSAICTNGIIGNGGAYFLLSRSLGPAFGGSIGVLFSIANATAVALHLVGFAETITSLLTKLESDFTICDGAGDGLWDLRLYAIACLMFLICVGLVGVSYVVKLQLNFLWLLIVSLVLYFVGTMRSADDSFAFTGYNATTFEDNLLPQFSGSETWITLFAVFFPASTGIMAGANISGDLKDAQKSIPFGTLSAVFVSGVTYVIMLFSIAATVERKEFRDGDGSPGLFNDYLVMYDISSWPPSVIVGIVASALSSALAALVGAPRVFQAVCEDGLFPGLKFLGKTTVVASGSPEPLRLYGVTFVIAIGIILIGDLNAIAPYITNFFMISYALINYAAFIAAHDNNPGWRPKWKYYNKWLALGGSFACVASMVMISWYTGIITLVLAFLLYKYVEGSPINKNWGNVHKSYRYSTAVNSVYKLEDAYRTTTTHVKNFRPAYLVMAGPVHTRVNLVKFVQQLRYGQGFTVVSNVMVGSFDNMSSKLCRERAQKYYSQNKFSVVPMALCSDSLLQGFRTCLQTAGVGVLSPNTVVMNFKKDASSSDDESLPMADYVRFLSDALKMNFSFVLLKGYHHIKRRISLPVYTKEGLEVVKQGYVTAKLKKDMDKAGIRRGADMFFDDESRRGDKSPKPSSPAMKNIDVSREYSSVGSFDSAAYDTSRDLSNGSYNAENEYSYDGLYSPSRKPHPNAKKSRRSSREIEAKGTLSRLPDLWRTFSKTQGARTGRVDVYWLCDHGGLSLLLPHILQKNPTWNQLSLRVIVPRDSQRSSSDDDQRKALELVLHQLRIRNSMATICPSAVDLEVFLTADDKLDSFYAKLETSSSSALAGAFEADSSSKSDETKSDSSCHRLRDIVAKLSHDATMVYFTAPHPDVKRPKRYMDLLRSWSSNIADVPCVYVHGSGNRVLSIEA